MSGGEDIDDGVVHFNLGASDPWDDEYPDVIFHRVPSADIVYETPPRIPKFIGKYLLGKVLGEGSYARDMLDSSEEKKFPLWQAHKYIVQTLHGLHYLHSKSIIHKDIKPANLLLDPSHTIKLCDFGVAEQIDLYTADDMVRGSQGAPMFQAPEIATGKEVFSGTKLDVWSAGVSLYNFVTGNYPFNAENVFKLYRKIGEGNFTIPDYLPEPLQHLLAGMLQYDYETRLTIKQALEQEWILRKHNKTYDQVAVPNNIAEESSLIPYLEQLHISDETIVENSTLVHPPQKSSSDIINTSSVEEGVSPHPHNLSLTEDAAAAPTLTPNTARRQGFSRSCKMQ